MLIYKYYKNKIDTVLAYRHHKKDIIIMNTRDVYNEVDGQYILLYSRNNLSFTTSKSKRILDTGIQFVKYMTVNSLKIKFTIDDPSINIYYYINDNGYLYIQLDYIEQALENKTEYNIKKHHKIAQITVPPNYIL